jgi:hypothetical protein
MATLHRSAILCSLLSSLTLAACGTNQQSKHLLVEALYEYSNGIRWGRSEWIQNHLPKGQESRVASSQLQVITCEVENIVMNVKDRAIATVRVDWYLLNQARLHSTLLRQTWVEVGGRWQIRDQRVAEGRPFPGLGRVSAPL